MFFKNQRTRAQLLRTPLVLSAAVLFNACNPSRQGVAGEEEFDHSAWNTIVKAHVKEEGWVDYKSIKAKHTGTLKGYLKALAGASAAKLKSREEKMAFWINAYNAVCVQTLLDNDVPASVPHAFVFGQNIFKERTYRIAGKIRSLEDIEHGILRKVYKDPRVHATLVCGASSCPRLRPEAYMGSKLSEQLDEESRRWVQVGKDKAGKRKNRMDRATKTYHVSKIFDWFEDDFGGGEAGVLSFLKKYGSKENAAFLSKNKVRIEHLDYSWKVNSQ